ncbi:hypothetical protein ABK040_014626 [Willaertia magna]
MLVKHFMIPRERVVKVSTGSRLKDVASRIVENDVGSVVVVDQNDHPIGIITKTDLVRCTIQNNNNNTTNNNTTTSGETIVDNVMSKDLVYAKDTLSNDQIATELMIKKLHHLLIENEESGEWVGLTTSIDVVREAALDAKAFPYNRETNFIK